MIKKHLLLILFMVFVVRAKAEAEGSVAQTLEIDNGMQVEIVDNKMTSEDAHRVFKYVTKYIYEKNTDESYRKTYEILEKIRKYYGKELDDDCILWQAKCKFSMDKYPPYYHTCQERVLDLLYQIEVMYPEGDIYKSSELKETIKEFIITTVTNCKCPCFSIIIVYYDFLKKLQCTQTELCKISHIIVGSYFVRGGKWKWCEDCDRERLYKYPRELRLAIDDEKETTGFLAEMIKKELNDNSQIRKLSGFDEEFYINVAKYIWNTYNKDLFILEGRKRIQYDIKFYEDEKCIGIRLKVGWVFEAILKIPNVPPLLNEIRENTKNTK